MDTWVLNVWFGVPRWDLCFQAKKPVFLLSLSDASVGSNFQESWGFPETGEEEAQER